MRTKIDYFPHNTDMSADPKIKALINNYGLEGYGLYNMLIENLSRSEGFAIKLDSEWDFEILAAGCWLQSEKFKGILKYIIKVDLMQIEQGFLRCRTLIKYITPLLEKREKDRKRKGYPQEEPNSNGKDENSNGKDENSNGKNDKGEYSKVKYSKVNFLGGGGKRTHDPTTDQKKNEIYENEETKEFLGANSDFLEKKEKSSAKKEKEAGQDELGEGKFEENVKVKGTEKGRSEKTKIDPILKEIENSVYIISEFSYSFAPHWERWVKHLETKKFVLTSEVQEFQQRGFIQRANEQGISVKDLENLLILEIAATIQNQDKTDKKLVALNPFFHKKVVENEKPNSSKRKYKSIYSNR